MELSKLIIPLGISAYSVMLFVVLTGLRVIKLKVKWHKTIALIGISLATIHAAIVIYFNFF